jgi:uncharacterized protein YgbK (DUF1537 family)
LTFRPWTVVLDDDPTGTQGISGIPAVIDAAADTLRWARSQADITYVLTNTRSQSPAAAEATVRDVVAAVTAVLGTENLDQVRFVSRGDSTLRGHFPLEVETIRETSPVDYAGCLLVPAFPAALRVTIDGTHRVGVNGTLVPVGESEFARDATFGYSESILTDWARARVPESWAVQPIPSSVFDSGVEAIQNALQEGDRFTVFCPDVRDESDLHLLAAAQNAAEKAGAHLLVQAAPAYPPVLAGLPPTTPLTGEVFHAGPGLIVVGSHTSVTSQQLVPLLDDGIPNIEIDVQRVAAGEGDAETRRCVAIAVTSLRNQTTIVSTSRDLHHGDDPDTSLRIASAVARVVSDVAQQLLHKVNPSYVISKGGITSHNMLADSLGWRSSTVLGPLVDATLPVLQSWDPTQSRTVCIVAPGNVGGPDLLSRALQRIHDLTIRRTS